LGKTGQINSHAAGKKSAVMRMFDDIAPKYDFLNHFLSLGIDKNWRKKTALILKKNNPKHILDVATGTGDLAITLNKILQPDKITGIDISEEMIRIGKQKLQREKLSEKIELIWGDSEDIPFENNKFDAATVAFGVRNFENLEKGLDEMHRILREGGQLAILEFSRPDNKFIGALYRFYFHSILPLLGNLISGSGFAYKYLPESVDNFPDFDEFLLILKKIGFDHVNGKKLSFGICAIYSGIK
jgi:demethylmenaquinone methyltransferase / 2-methoxy-6-polyprenyl-1,4-benzoquinol methylase